MHYWSPWVSGQLFDSLLQACKLVLKTCHMACNPRSNPRFSPSGLQIRLYMGCSFHHTENNIFLCHVSFNFPKIYLLKCFDIKSNIFYKIAIWMPHWNFPMIVSTKTLQSKQISCSHTINKFLKPNFWKKVLAKLWLF